MSTRNYSRIVSGKELALRCRAVEAAFKDANFRFNWSLSDVIEKAEMRHEHSWSLKVEIGETTVTFSFTDLWSDDFSVSMTGFLPPDSLLASFIEGKRGEWMFERW